MHAHSSSSAAHIHFNAFAFRVIAFKPEREREKLSNDTTDKKNHTLLPQFRIYVCTNDKSYRNTYHNNNFIVLIDASFPFLFSFNVSVCAFDKRYFVKRNGFKSIKFEMRTYYMIKGNMDKTMPVRMLRKFLCAFWDYRLSLMRNAYTRTSYILIVVRVD